MIKAIIATIAFYLLPLLLGRGIFSLAKKEKKQFTAIDCFALGSTAFFFLNLLIYYLFSSIGQTNLWINLFPWFLRIFSIGLLLFGFTQIKKFFLFLKKEWLVLLITILMATAAYGLWRYNTLYPLPLNWDFFHHQTLVNEIKKGRLSFINSRISDSFIFNGYSPLFHLLLGWPQWLIKPEPMEFFWWLEFGHLLTTLWVSYYLASQFLKTRSKALVATLFSAFIFESFMIYSPVMLMPQTLAGLIFAGSIGRVVKNKTFSLKNIQINLLLMALLHYAIGGATAILLIGAHWLSARREELKKSHIFELLTFLIIGLIFLIPSLPVFINLDHLNQGEAAAFNHPIIEKIGFYRTFGGYLLFGFLYLGAFLVLKSKKTSLKILLIIALALVLLTVLPLPYVFKFYTQGRHLIILLATIGFLFLFDRLKIFFLKGIIVSLLVVTLIIIFISSEGFIKNILRYQDSVAQISLAEVEVADYLKERYLKENVMLVSDPATQHIFEPLSGINTQGGAYTNKNTRKKLHQISLLDNQNKIRDQLWQVKDAVIDQEPEKIIFVLSGRYFFWQSAKLEEKNKLSYNVWVPADLTFNNQKYVEFLKEDSGFKEVFSNEAASIIEVSRPRFTIL